ncbi:MAG: nitroreductase/quinone reductase family protein [Mycobacteriaceae bacterium]
MAWYRNVTRTPQVRIQVGSKTIPVTAVPLPAEQGAESFARYAARHRLLAKPFAPPDDGCRSCGSCRADRAGEQRTVCAVLFGAVRAGQGPLAAPPAARVRTYDWTRSLGGDGVPRTTGDDTGEVRRVGKDRDDRRRWCG